MNHHPSEIIAWVFHIRSHWRQPMSLLGTTGIIENDIFSFAQHYIFATITWRVDLGSKLRVFWIRYSGLDRAIVRRRQEAMQQSLPLSERLLGPIRAGRHLSKKPSIDYRRLWKSFARSVRRNRAPYGNSSQI
jgi:hypothetical protein